MKTNEEIVEEFERWFVKDNGADVEPSILDPNGSAGPITDWLRTTLKAKDTSFIETVNALANNVINTGGTIDDLRFYLIEALTTTPDKQTEV